MLAKSVVDWRTFILGFELLHGFLGTIEAIVRHAEASHMIDHGVEVLQATTLARS